MMESVSKGLFAAVAVAVPLTILAATCATPPRANCFTCVERCAPFRVAACEPSWSHVAPLYCSCDPFTRLDDSPVIAPAPKGSR